MSHNVETMAYKGQKPWHGLGFEVTQDLTPEEMLKAAGLDWTVEKRKMFFDSGNGSKIHYPGKYTLTRVTDNQQLDVVGETYKPVQNAVAIDFFKKFTDAGHMTMETAGSLWNGRYIWALARLDRDFSVGKDDEVKGFLLLSQPHVHGKAMLLQFTAIRVVCWNTLTFAIGADLRGKKGGGAFRMAHSTAFTDEVKTQAEQVLGLAGDQMTLFKDAATLLSKKKIKAEAVTEYFTEVLRYKPVDPEKVKLKANGEEKEPRTPRLLPKFEDALEKAPGATLPSAKGTLWGALNAVTYVIDHEDGKDRETSLKNAWFAHKATIKRRALELAMQRAK